MISGEATHGIAKTCRYTRITRSAKITRTTSGAIRNAWSTLGIGLMRVRFNGGQV